MVNAVLKVANDVAKLPADVGKVEKHALEQEYSTTPRSELEIEREPPPRQRAEAAPQPSALTQYLEKKFSVVEAANSLLPLWRELVLHPARFFGKIRRSQNLQFRAAVYFCWLSSLCAVAFFVAASVLRNHLFGPTAAAESISSMDVINTIILEVSIFVLLFFIAMLSSVWIWLSILSAFKRVKFRPIMIAGMYAYVFIMTIGVMIEIIGWLFFGTELGVNYADAFSNLEKMAGPDWLLQAFLIVGAMWNHFVAPVFSTLAISYTSGVRPRRIIIGSMLLSSYIIVIFYASSLTLVYFNLV